MKFNISQNVYVRLTSLGHKILREQHEQLCRDIPNYKRPYFEPNIDKYGYTRFQMYHLMECFGSYMGLGCELPFDVDIKFNTEDLQPMEQEMTQPNEIVINTENWSDESKAAFEQLFSKGEEARINPSEPCPPKSENVFSSFDLDEKLRTLGALTTAFTATKGSYINSNVEKKIDELLKSFQE